MVAGPPAPPPPLAAALEEAGLANYSRKLCEDHSCSTVRQLLALDATSLDALIDALRPLPGHRVRLLQFVRAQREKAEREREYAARAGGGVGLSGSEPAPTAAQKREWRTSMAALRSGAAKRGTGADVHHQQQPGWSKMSDMPWEPGKGRAPSQAKAAAYISSVRVLKCGHSRVTVFDGPTPNATGRAQLLGTVGLASSMGSAAAGALGGDGVWPEPGPAWARAHELPPRTSKPSLQASLGSSSKGAARGSGRRHGGAAPINSAGFAANLAGAVDVDWRALSAKLPTGKDAAAVATRKELWKRADPNGNGYLSSAEVDLMVKEQVRLAHRRALAAHGQRRAAARACATAQPNGTRASDRTMRARRPACGAQVGEELFSAKPVLQQAFHAARRSGGGSQSGLRGDYVERKEFRTLLVALRQYYELYAMFNRLDTTDDRRIDRAEFGKGVDFIALWGVQLGEGQVEAEFAAIDSNGGGYILFDEFARWAISKALDLEDDDDFDDAEAAELKAVGYVAAGL